MPLITRPQVYRVVRELLPKAQFGPQELLQWLANVQERNERARQSHEKRCPPSVATPLVSLYKPSL